MASTIFLPPPISIKRSDRFFFLDTNDNAKSGRLINLMERVPALLEIAISSEIYAIDSSKFSLLLHPMLKVHLRMINSFDASFSS